MIRRSLSTIAWLAAVFLAASAPAAAHPHVWVEGTATLNFDAEGHVPTVTVAYAIDEMTTAVLLEGLDKNGNGVFERDELQALAAENAAALAEFDYFIEVAAGAARVPVTGAVGYDYVYEGDRLVLKLELALERAIDPAAEKVAIRLYDPTFYVLVELAPERPLLVNGVAADFCRVTVKGPSLTSDGVSLSDAVLETYEVPDNIGRDYADEIGLACGGSS